MRSLDAFRAPLDGDRARAPRSRSASARASAKSSNAWGYPYALDEFRPHFTLTNAVDEAEPIAATLAQEFARRVDSPLLRVDALALFAESGPDRAFTILRRFPLGGREAA